MVEVADIQILLLLDQVQELLIHIIMDQLTQDSVHDMLMEELQKWEVIKVLLPHKVMVILKVDIVMHGIGLMRVDLMVAMVDIEVEQRIEQMSE